ncbi:hypothetical protein L2E82_16955 [Cichorium intybus]|uniref:Uncharacterized protein n=1 Tax=Cichorium intybus TaxID=13427 RepID=A0ACB9F7X5_CICIN|nr:hypothetical protein L2E82_16955 [Cichorium intybus]
MYNINKENLLYHQIAKTLRYKIDRLSNLLEGVAAILGQILCCHRHEGTCCGGSLAGRPLRYRKDPSPALLFAEMNAFISIEVKCNILPSARGNAPENKLITQIHHLNPPLL